MGRRKGNNRGGMIETENDGDYEVLYYCGDSTFEAYSTAHTQDFALKKQVNKGSKIACSSTSTSYSRKECDDKSFRSVGSIHVYNVVY